MQHRPKELTEQEAKSVSLAIQKICFERGLWVRESKDYQPGLKFIKLEVSLKVRQ